MAKARQSVACTLRCLIKMALRGVILSWGNGLRYYNVLVWDMANAYPWGDFIARDAFGVGASG